MKTTTHKISVKGLEAHITLNQVVSGTHAYGISFDECANIITETKSRQFVGYCQWEIVYAIASDMLVTRRQIEAEDIAEAVNQITPECNCE